MFKKLAFTLLMTTMVFSASAAGPSQSQDKAQAAGAGTVQAKTADQLYPVEVNGKYGFINGKGTVVIEAVYDSYGYSGIPGGTVYVEDHAAKKQYYFSSAGTKLFEYKLRDAGILYNDRALYTAKVQPAGGAAATRYGYIDSQGKVAIQPIYVRAFHLRRTGPGQYGQSLRVH